ncbi:MAG: hypothetical protein IJX91_04550 [Clostridia bacterium]|nr:hypothetical protein [Clostridia bacterium]
MNQKERKDKETRDRILIVITRTEQRCQGADCTKCQYSHLGEDCYPTMLVRALRCSGLVLREEASRSAADKG